MLFNLYFILYKNRELPIKKCETEKICNLPSVHRCGTPGFRAPEIIFKSCNQNSKIDIYNAGLILVCIMLGIQKIFEPSNDWNQLQQFICIYGYQKVYETGVSLNRRMILHFSSQMSNVTNEELIFGDKKYKECCFSYKIKNRLQELGNDRKWSNDMFDLVDQLTAFDMRQRPTSEQALEHRIFRNIRNV